MVPALPVATFNIQPDRPRAGFLSLRPWPWVGRLSPDCGALPVVLTAIGLPCQTVKPCQVPALPSGLIVVPALPVARSPSNQTAQGQGHTPPCLSIKSNPTRQPKGRVPFVQETYPLKFFSDTRQFPPLSCHTPSSFSAGKILIPWAFNRRKHYLPPPSKAGFSLFPTRCIALVLTA